MTETPQPPIQALTLTDAERLQILEYWGTQEAFLQWLDSQTAPDSVTFLTLPAGFRPTSIQRLVVPYDTSPSAIMRYVAIFTTGVVYYGGPGYSPSDFRIETVYRTSEAWPTSLPV